MAPEEDIQAKPPCHPRACAIQDCLTKNSYNEARCQHLIDALYDCCDAFYRKNGDDASTVSCPKPNLLRLKLSQRQKEQARRAQ
ncbi:hypothetical protein Micbo1qcDRAFT_14793 [Microdochium bolleyi]|uniref:Cx9C motif-containing protein 4, mitochondrial n=1 Tax=Microdochium bolleyi TaxID=196109 RepID=A0A136IWC4_9PEZI|nr:hypothetical protein Micbo1qcDRAFT_14793 [Microdochium bolleyi]